MYLVFYSITYFIKHNTGPKHVNKMFQKKKQKNSAIKLPLLN